MDDLSLLNTPIPLNTPSRPLTHRDVRVGGLHLDDAGAHGGVVVDGGRVGVLAEDWSKEVSQHVDLHRLANDDIRVARVACGHQQLHTWGHTYT